MGSHYFNNYEAGSDDMDTCLAGWNAIVNYLVGAAFGPGGSGHFPNETITEWLMNADIGTLENLMGSYGIDYGYTYTPPPGYFVPGPSGAMDLKSPEAKAQLCQHWESCYYPATDYTTAFISYFVGVKLIRDDFGNWYFNLHFSSMPGAGLVRGDLNAAWSDGSYKDVSDLAVDQRELIVQEALKGWGGGANASLVLGGGVAGNPHNDVFYEGGFSLPGFASDAVVSGIVCNQRTSTV